MSCCDHDHAEEHHKEDQNAHQQVSHGSHIHTESCSHDEPKQHNHQQEEMIEGLSQQQKQAIKQQKRQKRLAQRKEHKAKYLPLFQFLKSKGLKFKQARFLKGSVDYFRLDDFKEILQKHKEQINQKAKIKQLLHKWQKIFIYYKRIENQPKLKWPQHLQLAQDKKAKFASFRFDTTQSSRSLTFLIVSGIIAAVLFPLWPYELKYLLFIVALYLTYLLVGIILLRLVFYIIFAVFGVSLWIFPRLMDNCTFAQSFIPLYAITKWQGNVYSVITRILVLSLLSYYSYHIYHDPNFITENVKITKTIMDDIHQWGDSKIKGQRGNFSQSALTDIKTVLNQTADAFEQQIDGEQSIPLQDSFDQLQEDQQA